MKEYVNEIRSISKIGRILEVSIISSIILILLDRINIVTKLLSNNFTMVISILTLGYIILRVAELKVFDLCKLNVINDIDLILIYVLFTSIIFFISSSVIFNQLTYRSYICILIILILIIFLYCRSRIIINNRKNSENDLYNIYDLKDLFEDKIDIQNKAILIDEEAVNYDLLGRDIFINNLYNTIIDNKARKKFVIALEGHWGSGKSTILNIVKNKLEHHDDIIIIEDFDPWNYNDQSSMFRAMFDSILRASKIRFSMSESKKFIDTMCEMIFDTKYGKQIKILDLRRHEKFNEITKIKKMINEYLNKNKKNVIFIIDNIDRADKENVGLLFKLVGSVLDFENITYILSYDDTKVKNIMSDDLNIDYDYLKKIIQLEVKVPIINDNIKINVVDKCIKNLLALYGTDKNELYKYNLLTKGISEVIKDIRDLKRFLNSVITFCYRSNQKLNPIDIITIETIKMYNIELYQSIIENKRYFISEDKIKDADLYKDVFIGADKFNTEGKDYFDSIFIKEENKKFLNILSEIFPYVNNYKNGKKLWNDGNIIYPYDKNEQASRVKEKRIYSAKFFDLYFTESSNYFTYINDLVDIFINKINNGNSIELRESFKNSIPKDIHSEFFNTLYLFISEINKDKLIDTLNILFENIKYIDNSNGFFVLSAKDRTCAIIADILLIIDEENLDKFIESVRFEYSKLQIISNIDSRLDKDKEAEEFHKESVYNKWNKMYQEMSSSIYDNNISIYESYYMEYNIYGLTQGIQRTSRDIKNYIKKVLNEQNIIRFLFDIMSKSTGTKVKYYIKVESINTFTTEDEINLILDMKDNYSKDEKIIRDIYKISMEHKGEEFIDDERLTFDQDLDFKI